MSNDFESEAAGRNAILDQVKRLVARRLSGTSAEAYLFGSWARGGEKRSSDIDVAIEFNNEDESNDRLLVVIRDDLEESTVPYRVDIINLHTADDYIVNKVRKEGIRWNVQ